jgi:ATP-dependent helicase/nuclease subunit B
MIFLGWNRPLLHATTDWLLDAEHVPEAPDLSGTIVVVRGRRAGRRLLELLALKCAERGRILVPPEIMTPARLIIRLTQSLPGELAPASPLASALAWAQALGSARDSDRDILFRRPGANEAKPSLRALLGLGKNLSQIGSELGGAGLGFRDVAQVLAERFPNIADFEVPRWEMLESLHRQAGQILKSHGLIDHTHLLVSRARRGEIIPGSRVVLAGVAEMPRIVREFIARMPDPPTALVFAPETEREGFEEPGVIQAEHWNKRRAELDVGQIHLVERDRDQAFRAAHIVTSWRESGIAPTQMTLAVPDTKALPRLREALDSCGVKTRWAQGRPASDAPAFQLLRLVADYLDHDPVEPPRYEAVAALVRHPDVARIDSADWSALDRFATEHLPERFDPGSVEGVSERAQKIQEVLGRWVDLAPDEISPKSAADWTLRFLIRVYGEREENALSPFGRVAVHALELLRDVLADTALDRMPWPERVRPADFLHVVLGFLGDQPVPEPPDPDAVEIVGWLELIEDDAPAVAVTSFFEGAVPETVSADPFLPGSLRQALGLGDNAMRMARDAYALAALLASRSDGRGAVVLMAPRFDPGDNPVRPSRLLLNGLEGESLARRVWHLAGKRESEPLPQLTDGRGFADVAPGDHPPVQKIRVTAFRDYIESPRKFFFLHVLGLKSESDDVLELQGGDVGTLIHQVLAAFGADARLRNSADETEVAAYLVEKFEEIVRARFGRWAQPAVEIQVEEVRQRLLGFARVQPKLRQEGWTIRYVEGKGALAFDLAGPENPRTLSVTGKIDRIDSNPSGERWRIIDYKTSAKKRDPWRAHYLSRSRKWIDLQLPLYLKLAAPYARAEWGVELTPDNCELVYFQLPEDEGTAGLSAPFPAEMIEEGWAMAANVAAKILRGEFEENPPLRPDPARNDPALLALCGQVGIRASEPTAAEGIAGD